MFLFGVVKTVHTAHCTRTGRRESRNLEHDALPHRKKKTNATGGAQAKYDRIAWCP